MTLGINDGTADRGLYNGTDANYTFLPSNTVLGQPVGTTGNGTNIVSNKSIGITLDPAKSGIITSKDSSKHLFFFVN